MLTTSTALLAVLPLLVASAPTRITERENDSHKDWSSEHDSDWSHSASAKDWKPYYRPSSKYYTLPTWKYDDTNEYTDGTAWFRDSNVENYPEYFTSFAVAYASPDTIINNNQTAVPGLPGGFGTFAFGLNSVDNVICYNITAYITGNYSSPAKTATHIHQAAVGSAGPPRLAFPNPEPASEGEDDGLELRYSYGCLQGPFTTGVVNNGTDTAEGFSIARLETDPTGFFADTHTAAYTAGAIRGQLKVVKWADEYPGDDHKDEDKEKGDHKEYDWSKEEKHY